MAHAHLEQPTGTGGQRHLADPWIERHGVRLTGVQVRHVRAHRAGHLRHVGAAVLERVERHGQGDVRSDRQPVDGLAQPGLDIGDLLLPAAVVERHAERALLGGCEDRHRSVAGRHLGVRHALAVLPGELDQRLPRASATLEVHLERLARDDGPRRLAERRRRTPLEPPQHHRSRPSHFFFLSLPVGAAATGVASSVQRASQAAGSRGA